MGMKADLESEISKIFSKTWTFRDGQKVPEPSDIQLENHGVRIDATVLYADLADSTDLVDTYPDYFAAEVYKAYLTCALRVINKNGGEITAFDGDRVMAVFIGDRKNTRAATTALQINWAVQNILNPKLHL